MASSFLADFALGAFSAALSKLTAAPFNRAKQMQQSQAELLRQGRLDRPFTGLWDAVVRTVRTEGPLGLWRGNLIDVLLYFPTQTFNFAFKDHFKNLLPFTKNQHGFGLWFFGNLTSGALAGATTLLFTYPWQLASTVLGADVLAPEIGRTSYQYAGAFDVWGKTLEHSGPLGLFSGFGVSVAGIILYRGCYFGLYDALKHELGNKGNSFLSSFTLGVGVSILSGLATYPLDTIRRRMMIASATPMAFEGTLDCVTTIWREEGLAGFFRGALANIARLIVGVVVLVLWDHLRDTLSRKPPAAKPRPAAN